jgi:tight adherence protein B
VTAVAVAVLLASAAWLLLYGADGKRLGHLVVGLRDRPSRGVQATTFSLWRWSGGRRRSEHQVEREALDLLDALAPALRAGLPPVTAVRLVVGPSSAGAGHFGGLDEAAARGEPLAPTWSAYAEAVGSEDLRLVAGAWSLCDTLGSPLAPTVSTVSDVVRRRRAIRTRIATALAGPRATMRVLTALPLSGPLVAVLVGVPPADLYAPPAGAAALLAGVTLLLVGRWWAGRMVRAVTAERPARSRPAHSRLAGPGPPRPPRTPRPPRRPRLPRPPRPSRPLSRRRPTAPRPLTGQGMSDPKRRRKPDEPVVARWTA